MIEEFTSRSNPTTTKERKDFIKRLRKRYRKL